MSKFTIRLIVNFEHAQEPLVLDILKKSFTYQKRYIMRELLRRVLGNLKNVGFIGGILLIISIVFFILFYLSVEDKMYDLLGSFLSLDWYWYLGIAILVLIKPLITLLRKNRKSKTNKKKK